MYEITDGMILRTALDNFITHTGSERVKAPGIFKPVMQDMIDRAEVMRKVLTDDMVTNILDGR
jgi:hypothetical protein